MYDGPMNNIIAGSIFTPGEWALLVVGGVSLAAVSISGLVWILMKLAGTVGSPHPKARYQKIFLIVSTTLTAAILLFAVVPTIIDDRQYLAKQKECGQKVGLDYKLINSNRATASQQESFYDCLSE